MDNKAPEPCRGIASAERFFQEYHKYLGKLLGNLDYRVLEEVTTLILEKSRKGQTIFLIGNGGSAATASHFATDLIQCSQPEAGLYFRAISLVDNVSLVTALGNDNGYEAIFTDQMRTFFRKDDVLIAISASGNSPNVIAAARLANQLGGVVVGLVGFDGGELARICDHVIHACSNKGEYGPVEDIHLIIDHMVTSYLRMKLGRA